MIDRDVHRMARVPVLRGRARATERLEVDERVEPAVCREQERPLLLGAALRDHAAHRVALDAGELDPRVAGIVVVDHAPLDLEAARTKLLGGEALLVAEVAGDGPGVGGVEARSVQRDHPPDRRLPAFRRLAEVGDPGHATVVVRDMAPGAPIDDRLVPDLEAVRVLLAGDRRNAVRGEEARDREADGAVVESCEGRHPFRGFGSERDGAHVGPAGPATPGGRAILSRRGARGSRRRTPSRARSGSPGG